MAEFLVISPLVNLGIFLTQWLLNKRRENALNKEYFREAAELVSAVESLGAYANEKAGEIERFHREFGIQSSALGNRF